MSKLNVDQKTILGLLSDKKSFFRIPDYQRPYAWKEETCQTLWDDLFDFAFPEQDYTKFDSDNDEYYLGSIVTYKNNDELEVIDGQQRLTTIMLLLRAFFAKMGNMQDENSQKTREVLAKCIWKTDEFDTPLTDKLKIDSDVASDEDKSEFLEILQSGEAPKTMSSLYAQNYRFFQKKIAEFNNEYPSYFSYLPTRILKNCIFLPVEADSQNTALRIFSTLNDRGLPLSDADIFKAQLYKFYSSLGHDEKSIFIERWKVLEETSKETFHPTKGTPMDELFTLYMYYERAKQGNKSSTTEALRKFYEKNNYELLRNEFILQNLETLAKFWNDIQKQNPNRFSDRVLRKLFVLNYAPNKMWTYITSVFYMANKDSNGMLNDELFYAFLNRTTAFTWGYSIYRPGLNSLRTPLFTEMINIVNGRPATFSEWRFNEQTLRSMIDSYAFLNNRSITKSMLTWWAFSSNEQQLQNIDAATKFDIEHIFAKKR